MIIGVFNLGGEQIEVIVDGENTMFRDTGSGMTTTIHGLRLNKAGVIKEHPDLEGDEEWKTKAIERLKEHIKKLKTENKKLDYIKDELAKFGYTPKYKQRVGWRPERF